MAVFGSHGNTEDIKITQSGSVQNLPKESSEFRKTAREYCEQNLALCWPVFLAPFDHVIFHDMGLFLLDSTHPS